MFTKRFLVILSQIVNEKKKKVEKLKLKKFMMKYSPEINFNLNDKLIHRYHVINKRLNNEYSKHYVSENSTKER